MRKALIASIVLGLLLLIPGAAHAVDNVTIDVVTAPPPNSVLRGEQSFPVQLRAKADSSLKSFAMSILLAESGVSGMHVNNGSAGGSWGTGATDEATLQVNWDTRSVTPYNGRYRVAAIAESHLGAVKDFALEGYVVDNPAAQVNNLDAKLEGGTPSLSWDANTEPDLKGYQVFRAQGSGEYKKIASVNALTFTDKDVPNDIELKYYVVATRRSVVSEDRLIASPPSLVRTFLIPSPESGEQPVISAPQEAPEAPPVPKVAARPGAKIAHQGFDEMLPYTGVGESGQAPFPVGEQAPETTEETAFAPPSSLSVSQIYKPPFLAGALLLLAAAGHMIRLAISLFNTAEPRGQTNPAQPKPASSS